MTRHRILVALAAGLVLALAAACGGGEDAADDRTGELSGRIQADGSSTVAPFTTAAAEQFQREHPGVQITVGVSGTGGGFERFCAGETDLSNASRPIEGEEESICRKNGVEYVQLRVANDAVTVVVNPANGWARCLTVEQLRAIWSPGSTVRSWKDVDPSFPDERLSLYGPGTDSGTFDYFTEETVGEEGRSRSDYQASENDNVLVRGVSAEKGALAYFGFSYYDQNRSRLEALEIDSGGGCVAPSVATAQSGAYKPLSRPLFVYAKKASLERPEVRRFVRYMLDNSEEIAKASLFVPLTTEQRAEGRRAFERATARS